MGDIDQNKSTQSVRVVGGDENHAVDVVLDDGVKKLAAKADVTVNSLRGFDPIADTWFYIGTEQDSLGAGGIGDTVRVQIAAGDNLFIVFRNLIISCVISGVFASIFLMRLRRFSEPPIYDLLGFG